METHSTARQMDWLVRPVKRSRIGDEMQDTEGFYFLAKLTRPDQIKHNVVWISPSLMEKHRRGSYVEIAGYVYKAAALHWLQEQQIGLNDIQYMELREHFFQFNHHDVVCMRSFSADSVEILPKVSVTITTDPKYSAETASGPIVLTYEALVRNLKTLLKGQIVSKDQSFYLECDYGLLYLTIRSLNCKNNKLQQSSFWRGKIARTTLFDIYSGAGISIVKSVGSEQIEHAYFRIRFISSKCRSKEVAVPVAVLASKVQEVVEKSFIGPYVVPRQKVEFVDYRNNIFEVELAKVHTEETDKFECQYKLDDSIPIEWKPASNVVLDKGESCKAAKIKLRILGYSGTDADKTLRKKRKFWLSAEEMRRALMERSAPYCETEEFFLKLSSGEYRLEVRSAFDADGRRDKKNDSCKTSWMLNDVTNISLSVAPKMGIQLVDTAQALALKTLKLEIAGEALSGLFRMLSGGRANQTRIIKEEDLEELFREEAGKKFLDKQQVSLDLLGAGTVEMKVAEMIFVEKAPDNITYAILGRVTKDTEIIFKGGDDADIAIQPKQRYFNLHEMETKLNEMGIGGLDDQIAKIRKFVLVRRGKHRAIADKMGLKPEKGVLLYGPPGTGKTALANALADLLGTSGAHVKKICASEVWNKYVGESEKMVRDLFKAAIEDKNKHKENAGFHVIIIDEADSILGQRHGDSRSWEVGVLNQFLNYMDGKSDPVLDNVLVIIMTNRKDKLDPAILRPGRFGVQLEVGVPDKKGARQILDIHLRNLREEGCLADDINYDVILNKIKGWTGAQIMSLAQKATSSALERMTDSDNPDEKPIVTQKDLMETLEEINLKAAEVEKYSSYIS